MKINNVSTGVPENRIREYIYGYHLGDTCEISCGSSRLSFTSAQLPFCCGIIEIGDIDVDKGLLAKRLDNVFKAFFEAVKLIHGKAIIINLNMADSSCRTFDLYIKENKSFKEVISFINSSTSNTIKTYIYEA